jgi:hypothetical protein
MPAGWIPMASVTNNNKPEKDKTHMKATKANNLTVEQVRAAAAALLARREAMPFLLSLPPEQREKRRLGGKALRFAESRLEAARQHRESLPAAFDFRRFEREVGVAAALEECLIVADSICQRLQDTLQVIGTRNVRAGAEVFGYIKTASNAAPGLKSTVEQLTKHRQAAPARPRDSRRLPEPKAGPSPATSESPATPPAASRPTPPDEKAA